MERQSIGKFIAALRKANGMTQADLAERLGVTNKSVSKWERDECYPDLTLIPIIAEIFSVSADEILKGARIIKDEGGTKPKPPTDKQINGLIQRKLSNFKLLSLIPIFISIVGVIFLILPIAIQGGKVFDIICVVIFILFSTISIILEIIFSVRAKTALFSIDDESTPEKRLLKAAKTIESYTFNIITINAILMTAIAFLYAIDSKIIFFPALAVTAYLCATVVKTLVTDKKYHNTIPPETKTKLKKLNILSIAAAAISSVTTLTLLILSFVLPPNTIAHYTETQTPGGDTIGKIPNSESIIGKATTTGINNEFLITSILITFLATLIITITYLTLRKKLLTPFNKLK